MQGSGLQGPIPSSISRLEKLTDLWVKISWLFSLLIITVIECYHKNFRRDLLFWKLKWHFYMQEDKRYKCHRAGFSCNEQNNRPHTFVCPLLIILCSVLKCIRSFCHLTIIPDVSFRYLRSCNISGEIPPYIWTMSQLQVL